MRNIFILALILSSSLSYAAVSDVKCTAEVQVFSQIHTDFPRPIAIEPLANFTITLKTETAVMLEGKVRGLEFQVTLIENGDKGIKASLQISKEARGRGSLAIDNTQATTQITQDQPARLNYVTVIEQAQGISKMGKLACELP